MLSTTNLTALFHDMVRAAMAAQQVASSETTEFYLVQLLEAFARPARGNLLDPPFALDYLEAFHLPAPKRYEKLKRVADTALFVTGVFVDSLERSLGRRLRFDSRRSAKGLDRPPRSGAHRRCDGAPASPLRDSAPRACRGSSPPRLGRTRPRVRAAAG